MPKAKPKETFEIVLFNGLATDSGNKYDLATIESIAMNINSGNGPILEEMDPIGRKVQGKELYEVWKEHAMADAVSCRLENSVLFVTFAIRNTKYGKMLKSTLDTHGIRGIYFFPVGYGTPDSDGVIQGYHLCYVSFEPRNAMKVGSNGNQ